MFKKSILKGARMCGCDIDGDIFIYRGNKYYVHVLNEDVKLLETNVYGLPFLKRIRVMGCGGIIVGLENISFKRKLRNLIKSFKEWW